MHGADHNGGDHSYGHHNGGDHLYGHSAGHGPGHHNHTPGGGDHQPLGSHDLTLAHAGDVLGHSGSIAIDAVVFMAFVDWAAGHHGSGFHYSFANNGVNVHYNGRPDHIDGTGKGGLNLKKKVRAPLTGGLRAVPVNAVQAKKDSNIFIVHAHNIGNPDLDVLLSTLPQRFGFVEVTDYPGLKGENEDGKGKGVCYGWDWFRPKDGPLPPGALPGVVVNSTRDKRIFQLGKPNPNLPWWRRAQLYLGIGRLARPNELVPDIHQNCTTESFDSQWVYDALGTAEAKVEFRVKANKRYYPGVPAFMGWLFSRRGMLPHWSIVWEPYEAHRVATLALAKALHKELSEFKRVPGKLESYMDMLSRLPDGDKYVSPPDIPDGVTPGTEKDAEEMTEYDLEQARKQDRNSDSQLPTTTAPLPTTPATPVTPGPTVDGLPPDPSANTGSAIDGLPGYTQYAPAPPTPAVEALASATELAPSAPGYVTADLALPAAAPLPETQYKLNGTPVRTVDSNGTVEVHVNVSDFPDYRGHHA